MSGGYCAAGVLNGFSRFFFEKVEGLVAGGTEGFLAQKFLAPILIAAIVPGANMVNVEVLTIFSEAFDDSLVGEAVQEHLADFIADSFWELGDKAGAAVGIGGFRTGRFGGWGRGRSFGGVGGGARRVHSSKAQIFMFTIYRSTKGVT